MADGENQEGLPEDDGLPKPDEAIVLVSNLTPEEIKWLRQQALLRAMSWEELLSMAMVLGLQDIDPPISELMRSVLQEGVAKIPTVGQKVAQDEAAKLGRELGDQGDLN